MAIGCGIVAVFIAAVALGVIAIQKSGGFAALVNGFNRDEHSKWRLCSDTQRKQT